jgi:hypothetical protein
MGTQVRLLITALIVALLLGSVLTSAAFAQGPYSYYVPGYSTGSLSTSFGQSWYFTYYPGAPGYSSFYTPGTLGYSYANPYPLGPLYGGYGFGYPYNNSYGQSYGYGFSYPNGFPGCCR